MDISTTRVKLEQLTSKFVVVTISWCIVANKVAFLHKLLLRNALGNMQTSQEYFTTIVYAKFGGQTECIMDNWKIVNKFYMYPVKINCEITY